MVKKKLPSHITQLTNKKYRVRYKKTNKFLIPYDKTFNELEDAIKANNEYLAKNTLNLLSPKRKKDIKFSDFCDHVLDWYKKKPKRPSHNTIRSYRRDMNRLKVIFGNENIRDITSYRIETALVQEKNRTKVSNGAKPDEKITDNTLHHEFTMLRIIMNKATSWHFIDENPMNEVEEPTYEEKKIIVPEYEKINEIEEKILTAPIRERCQFLLAFYTGIRAEEVCGIRLNEDIDRNNKILSIKRAVVQNDETGEFIEDVTKSQASVRKIPLPDCFFEVLDEYEEYRKSFVNLLKIKSKGEYKEKPNLFLNVNGDLYRPQRLSRKWAEFAKKKNIDLTFHGLRHYYITNQMNYNEDLSPRDVQELAGHSNIKTTFKYVHPSQERINKNATNLFTKFSKNELHKNGNDILTIPISHIATIILGNPRLSSTEELQITLREMSNEDVNFFNISNIMENCKNYLQANYPSLSRIEKYKYINKDEKEIINCIKKEFGQEFQIQTIKENDLML